MRITINGVERDATPEEEVIIAKAQADMAGAPKIVPPVSRLQFWTNMAQLHPDLVSQDEALAALQTGTVPASIESFLALLPEDQAFAARTTLAGMTVVERSDPMVAAFLTWADIDSATADLVWTTTQEGVQP